MTRPAANPYDLGEPARAALNARDAEVLDYIDALYRSAVVGWPDATLRFAPPGQTSPTVVNLGTGFYGGSFAADEDVTLVMPAAQRSSNCQVDGGRHVRIIGGKHVHGTTGAAYYFTNTHGSVFLEGMDVDMNGRNTDAINVAGAAGAAPDVYLQNMRVTGVTGTAATEHADIFQPLGPIGTLRVDKLTGRSNYQAFFLAQQNPIGAVEMHRMDLAYGAGGDATTQLLWWGSPGVDEFYPVVLGGDVYIVPRAGQTLSQSVYPDDSTSADYAPIVAADGSISWPPAVQVAGLIKPGPPPGGDFVPAAAVGLGYASPGYRA